MNFQAILLALFMSTMLFACEQNDKDKLGNTQEQTSPEKHTEKVDSLLAAINHRIAENPKDYKNYLERAQYYGDQNKYGLAYQDIERAMKIDSTKSEIYYHKGRLLFKQDKIKEAYNEYTNCITKDDLNTECKLRKAEIDILLGNYQLARELLNDVLKQNEYNAEAYYIRGRLYKALKDTSLSASSYKTAIELNPNYYDAYVEVGLLYASQKSELAKEYYNTAIEIQPKSIEAWYNKAMFLQETANKKNMRYREAFACYDSILKIDSRFSAAYFNKGYIYLEYMQKYDSAAYQFTNAIATHPTYYQAYYNRGLSYESMDKRKDAEVDYRSALSIEPTYTEAAIALDRVLKSK